MHAYLKAVNKLQDLPNLLPSSFPPPSKIKRLVKPTYSNTGLDIIQAQVRGCLLTIPNSS